MTNKFTVTVEVEVDGDAKEMRTLVADYLASQGCTFFEDYGYDAWGGYSGPFAVACTVKAEDGSVLSKHECRDKPEPEDE